LRLPTLGETLKLFTCRNCGQTVFFESQICVRCGFRLAFAPRQMAMLAAPADQPILVWRGPENTETELVLCANAEFAVCNWLTDADNSFCLACRHNRTIPHLGDPANIDLWGRLERAKHYLFYGLLRFGIEPGDDLVFDFLADDSEKAMTGHESGVVTIALAEADDAERERRRTLLREPYRTLLGHFRHEVGHYFWDKLVAAHGVLDDFRAAFGDETADYGTALQRYYDEGPAPNWQESFVSAYASMHPWEDFAESWAHYLHIVDTMETAASVGLAVKLPGEGDPARWPVAFDPYRAETAELLTAAWVPLSIALNTINRSMGQPDLYPFVLASGLGPKLAFIHRLIAAERHGQAG
jgi:hypothetical protein